MISFSILPKSEAKNILPLLFRILHSNMSVIAPTGNSYDEDYRLWHNAVAPALNRDERQIILINDDTEIIGYFQYYVNTTTFMMEEIQFGKEYHGAGLFRRLYSFLFEIIPQEILYIEAYAHKQNQKSQGILKHLGLQIIGENKNGNSYRFRGDCRQALKKYDARESAIKEMTLQISNILFDCSPSVYLYGSLPLGDFRFGWSDIDILVLTDKQMSEEQAQTLARLRQAMLDKEPGNLYYRSFEGGMLTLDAFLSGKADRVVYWGTGGERITDTYMFDSFGMTVLIESSVLLYGNDVRNQLKAPEYSELYADVKRHYETIRKHVQKTGRNLYSFGWLLDIARCLYTLRTGKIIAKTAAADWALENNLCPVPDALKTALKVRRAPLEYKDDKTFDYAETLAEPIQRFADVLEKELEKRDIMVKTVDIHGANAHKTFSKTRVGCRGIVIKDSRMLISHEVNSDYYLIPGGGLEENETVEECCAREVREETGYIVKPITHFLTINEYYEEYKFVSHYFVCDITGKSEQNLTATEIERGLIPEWIDSEKMLEVYSKHDDFAASNEEKRGAYLREYTALAKYFALFS